MSHPATAGAACEAHAPGKAPGFVRTYIFYSPPEGEEDFLSQDRVPLRARAGPAHLPPHEGKT